MKSKKLIQNYIKNKVYSILKEEYAERMSDDSDDNFNKPNSERFNNDKIKEEKFKQYVLKNMDFDGYDDYPKPTNEKEMFRTALNIFKDEKSYDIKRYGLKAKLFADYLQGLPTWANYEDTEYDKIKDTMFRLGFNEVENMDDAELSDFFYKKIAETIIKNAQ